MDLQGIEVFVAVVESGSFTAAGRRLGLPKSTVSRRIARLEDGLGARLLQRTTRKLTVTEVGTRLYERCARILTDIRAAEREVHQTHASPRGRLAVTIPVDLADDRIAGLVASFMEHYPDVTLELRATNAVLDLVAEGIDVGIRGGSLDDSSLIARRLCRGGRVVVASPAYLAAHGTPTNTADLGAHALIGFKTGRSRVVDVPGAGPGATRRVVADHLGVVRGLALAGAGIAALPMAIARLHLEQGALVSLDIEVTETTGGGIFAVYPSRRHLSPTVRAFVDYLVLNFERATRGQALLPPTEDEGHGRHP